MAGTEIYRLYKNSHCHIIVTEYEDGRRSSYISGEWGGIVDQFREGETLKEIIGSSIEWLDKKIKQKHDGQYSSKKAYQWLHKNLKKLYDEGTF